MSSEEVTRRHVPLRAALGDRRTQQESETGDADLYIMASNSSMHTLVEAFPDTRAPLGDRRDSKCTYLLCSPDPVN